MTTLDAEVTFAQLDKLRERMDRLEKEPDANEWQSTRLMIRALTEGIAKSKMTPLSVPRKVRVDAPDAVSGDWDELVDVLRKKGFPSESRRAASKRE